MFSTAPLRTLSATALGLAALVSVGCISAPGATPDEKRQAIDESSDQTMQMIIADKGVTQQQIMDAAGYATITNIGTQILVLGADDGYGVLVDNESGERTYLDVNSIDFGPGVGIAKYRTLLIFETKEKLDMFKNGEWEFGADVAAVAKTGDGTGASAESSSSFDQDVDVYITGEEGLAVSANIRNMEVEIDRELSPDAPMDK